jgi:UDP-N-acetylmuramoyl-tripeptide--D-alanyl-D-alanine ligase
VAFRLSTPSGRIGVTLATPARIMVANALAAAAAGEVMGVGLERIKAGLEAFAPSAGRLEIGTPGRDLRVLDDTYNANPASMAAAIDTLAGLCGNRRSLAVLGDMLELGPDSAQLHLTVGRLVGRAGIHRLYVTGQFATDVAQGARDAAMPAACIVTGSKSELIARIEAELAEGDVILVKGSRGMAMEQVVAAIVRWAEGSGRKTEDRGLRTEVRSQESGDGSPESGD